MDTREPTGPRAADGSSGGAGMKEDVKSLLQDARQEASRLTETARERVTETAMSKKDAAAGTIGAVAGALRAAGERLQREDAGIGRYAASAAEQADRLAGYVRRNDVGGMVRDAETFARRHPELFLGIAFLGGIVAARFLKSSPPRPKGPEPMQASGYGSDYASGYGYQTGAPFNPPPSPPLGTPHAGGPGSSGSGGL